MRMHSWEPPLLSLAYDAVHSVIPVREHFTVEQEAVAEAYAHVEAVTAEHSRSFYLASSLLPREKRQAVRALYAFCRSADDLVDSGETSANDVDRAMAAWRHSLANGHGHATDPVSLAWADARSRYGIPSKYAEQLLDGVARDLHQSRYDSFDELVTYCYGVASTVGLMSMHIIGFTDRAAIPYAIKLGVALQITNILRDVGEDWRMGRLYLPREELELHGLSEYDVAAGRVDDRWRSFMRFQIERNRSLYEEAKPGIGLLDADGRFAISAAAELYAAILDEIEKAGYDVFTRRSYVGTIRKLRMLPGIWWRSR